MGRAATAAVQSALIIRGGAANDRGQIVDHQPIQLRHRDGRAVRRVQDGASYTYHDLPPEEFDAFCVAPSQGAYLNTHIKPNYRVTRGGRPK